MSTIQIGHFSSKVVIGYDFGLLALAGGNLLIAIEDGNRTSS